MNKKLISIQNKQYLDSFLKYGDSPKSVLWSDSSSQYLKFRKVTQHFLSLKDTFSLHEIGSGLCDLHKYLLENNVNHIYSGTEIVEEMKVYSERKFPEVKIFNRDILDAPINEKYDLLVVSGTFNGLFGCDLEAWEQYVYLVIKKMFEMSEIGISFNFLTTNNNYKDSNLFYLNPIEVFKYCTNELSRFIILDQVCPTYEVTITLFKEDFVRLYFNHESFVRYFNYKKIE